MAAVLIQLELSPASAQTSDNLVGACSGVSLPRSVVTDILGPVVTNAVQPIQDHLNTSLDLLETPLITFPDLSVDVAGELAAAAAGDPVTLQVLAADGTLVGPSDGCDLQADSSQLAEEGGIAIGGNRIQGLGAEGKEAVSGEIGSIAFGNGATTDATATGSIAIGSDAAVTADAAGSVALGQGASAEAASSIALGAGSRALRGMSPGYYAAALDHPQSSVGEVSVGAAGAERQITNVAPGSFDTDAVNVAQLRSVMTDVADVGGQLAGISTSLGDLAASALVYDDGGRTVATLGDGATPVALRNVADGAFDGDAVNVSQLRAVTDQVMLLDQLAVRYDDASRGTVTLAPGAGPVGLENLAPAALAPGSTDGVNGGQVFLLGTSIAGSLGGSSAFDGATGTVTAGIEYGGQTYDDIQSVVGEIELSLADRSSGGGSGSRYFNATSAGADSQARGMDSTAIGPNAIADADGAIAAGRNTKAMAENSVAIGDGAEAWNGKAVAIGFANIASGDGAVAIGDPNLATGEGAVAMGKDNEATGTGAVGLGNTNIVIGDGAVGLGDRNAVEGAGAIALGGRNTVSGNNSLAFGGANSVTGAKALAIGVNNMVSGSRTFAIGSEIVADAGDALAIGNQVSANALSATAVGNRARAAGELSSAFGTDAMAGADFALAIGDQAEALGFEGTAIGTKAEATSDLTVALGKEASATGRNATALGALSWASGEKALAVGEAAVAAGEASTAMGTTASAGGRFAVAIGQDAQADVIGATALGYISEANAPGSLAIGAGAQANAEASVALGGLSAANRGAQTDYVAFGLSDLQDSISEVAVGRSVVVNGEDGNPLPPGFRQITGVAAGSAGTDAVNVAQLQGVSGLLGTALVAGLGGGASYDPLTGRTTGPSYVVNGQSYSDVGAALSAVSVSPSAPGGTVSNAVLYDDGTRALITLNGGAGSVIMGLSDGEVAEDSRQAVNGRQLWEVRELSLLNAQKIAQLGGSGAGGSGTLVPLRYVDLGSGAPAAHPTNKVMLVGKDGAAVVIGNVSDGAVAEGSTQAVNGGQLHVTRVQLAEAQAQAAEALGRTRLAVRYDTPHKTSVTLGAPGASVRLRNVARGEADTDAVNLAQLNEGMAGAVQQSMAYTDQAALGLLRDIDRTSRAANAGTATALAAASLPQATEAGKSLLALGVGHYTRQNGVAVGYSRAFNDGETLFRLGGTYNSQGHLGTAAGVGWQF